MQTRSIRRRQATGFFNDGGGKQSPPGEMLVAPPKNRFLFSKPWGSLLLHQNKHKEKGGEETLSLPGTQNNAIKSVGFYATMAGQSRVSVLPGRQKIVKKYKFFAAPAVRIVPSARFFQKVKLFKHFEDRPVQGITSHGDISPINDGGGKGVRDISEVYYQTQRFLLHPRATVLCTNEWRHIHRTKHGLFPQVLHKVVPTQKLWKSKVSLEPFQSIKQWVLIQWIYLTLRNDEGRIGW